MGRVALAKALERSQGRKLGVADDERFVALRILLDVVLLCGISN
jgi:hypothetical protein